MTASSVLPGGFTAGVPTPITGGSPTAALLNLVVYGLLSMLVTGGLAVAYRWYFKQTVPSGVAGFVGVSVVALYINTTSLGVAVGDSSVDLFEPGTVVFNIVALSLAAVVAPVGRRLGETASSTLLSLAGLGAFDGEVGTVVRSAGRVTTITLPDAIDDMESYDPVTDETKAELAGKTLVFPRGLTVAELRTRLIERLKTDYEIGYVDVDLTADATIDYLAVGSRAAGIGATVAPRRPTEQRLTGRYGAGVDDNCGAETRGDRRTSRCRRRHGDACYRRRGCVAAVADRGVSAGDAARRAAGRPRVCDAVAERR